MPSWLLNVMVLELSVYLPGWVCLILTCKQNESSLVLSSAEWSHLAFSFTYTAPSCNWHALSLLGLELASFFWKERLVKCPNLWQALHWYFLLGTGIPLCELYLHIWNIYFICFGMHSWVQTFSCGGFVLDNFHWHVPCDLIVLASQVTSSLLEDNWLASL